MALTDNVGGDLKVMVRSWRQYFGMQFATVSVLTATFSVIAFMLCMSLNFQRVLTVWGEQVQLSAYLDDGASRSVLDALEKDLSARPEVSSVEYVSKEKAANLFRDQMASYAPDLMSDAEFATPFPASLQIKLRAGEGYDTNVAALERLAKELQNREGVEDVSYGQSWVRNYASFVTVIQSMGAVLGLILLCGSLFIVGNSIRALIAGRKEEIEILELIGATSSNIRRPYILEGILLCTVSAILAVAVNAVVYGWQITVMKKSLAFARMAQEFQYFSISQGFMFLLIAAFVGGIGAWLTVRRMNDGFSAARGVSS